MTKQDYKSYLASDHWLATRKRKLQSVGNRCERCGNRHCVQVHHKSYANLWNESDDELEALCQNHHVLVHLEKAKCRDCGKAICSIPPQLGEYTRIPERCRQCEELDLIIWCNR